MQLHLSGSAPVLRIRPNLPLTGQTARCRSQCHCFRDRPANERTAPRLFVSDQNRDNCASMASSTVGPPLPTPPPHRLGLEAQRVGQLLPRQVARLNARRLHLHQWSSALKAHRVSSLEVRRLIPWRSVKPQNQVSKVAEQAPRLAGFGCGGYRGAEWIRKQRQRAAAQYLARQSEESWNSHNQFRRASFK